VSDPIAQGLVSNLARPGGNITGFSIFEPGMGGKWLDLLKKIAPHTARVAVMFNPVISPVNELFQRSVEDAARSFDIEVTRAPVHDDREIEAVLRARKNTAIASRPHPALIRISLGSAEQTVYQTVS
jgi:putative tryptophan/tyrosine transport system substrate-binding protein